MITDLRTFHQNRSLGLTRLDAFKMAWWNSWHPKTDSGRSHLNLTLYEWLTGKGIEKKHKAAKQARLDLHKRRGLRTDESWIP